MFKKTAILIGFSILTVGALENPAHADGMRKATRLISQHQCTASQTAEMHFLAKLQDVGVQIGQRYEGPGERSIVNHLFDFISDRDARLPDACRFGG